MSAKGIVLLLLVGALALQGGAAGIADPPPGEDLTDTMGPPAAAAARTEPTMAATQTIRIAVEDTTPPIINLYPLPAITDEPALSVRGTVSDASPCNVTVNGVWALASTTGVFLVWVHLAPGNNTISVDAIDAAGNEAVVRGFVEFVPPEYWFSHPEKHFRIPVPYGWEGYANFTRDGVPVDLYLYATAMGANLIVVSEERNLAGTSTEARAILSEATDDLGREPGFRFLDSTFDRTIDGHTAATAFVTWQPPGETVDQVITIVLGPEYAMFWAVIGTMEPGNVSEAAPLINRTTAAFDILPPPSFDILLWRTHILVAMLAATVAEGGYIACRVLQARRRRMPWDRAYL